MLFGLAGLAVSALAQTSLVMVVDTSAVMPEARIEGRRVLDGLHADLGAALARRLGRPVQMLALPRKRIAQALQSGEADLVCDYQSAWLPGPFAWSRAFIPDQTVLVTAAATPAPAGLAAVAGQPVGTVLGYAYPEVAAALGSGLVRDDAPDAVANLRKLELGRVPHVVTGRRLLDYQRRVGSFKLALHPPLVVAEVLGQCGLSPRSGVTLKALNAAIQGMVAEGELGRILGKYR
ncbi:ABC-type amino acid transport substrate-binding protein [Pelomonas saccharophila]|uniref:ABC-type amino acid transport substrate-binding protein n=2 Tax=Roseateles saccharophilus TaxID=304 RepID=A0ABU1YMD2_ROSSA|nr:ABC-type amino acid transport substrate-binding protein [Roseateles saccharophilus]